MINLTPAIFVHMTSASALYGDIGGRLFQAEADEGTDLPYVVFLVVWDTPEYPGGKVIEEVLVQFSIFSSAHGSTEVETILKDLRTLYDDCVLTITDNTQIYFIRGNLTTMRDEITTTEGMLGVWHYAQEYTVQMVKT